MPNPLYFLEGDPLMSSGPFEFQIPEQGFEGKGILFF